MSDQIIIGNIDDTELVLDLASPVNGFSTVTLTHNRLIIGVSVYKPLCLDSIKWILERHEVEYNRLIDAFNSFCATLYCLDQQAEPECSEYYCTLRHDREMADRLRKDLLLHLANDIAGRASCYQHDLKHYPYQSGDDTPSTNLGLPLPKCKHGLFLQREYCYDCYEEQRHSVAVEPYPLPEKVAKEPREEVPVDPIDLPF